MMHRGASMLKVLVGGDPISAEGKGLTRRVWPQIATALSNEGKTYSDDDISWVLGHAGWHIIETGEDGQAVYRLAHQAFSDHYRSRMGTTEATGRIVAALSRHIEHALLGF